MGLVCTKILFESGIPTLNTIRAAYLKQTGLTLGLAASLWMQHLTTDSNQILAVLQQDAEQLEKLEQQSKLVWDTARLTQDYQNAAHYRDTQYSPAKNELSHIEGLIFMIYGFYEINFFIQNNTIEISYPLGLEYGASSLVKTLIDVGGKFEDSRSKYPKEWFRLRKWEDYNWWNRPRK